MTRIRALRSILISLFFNAMLFNLFLSDFGFSQDQQALPYSKPEPPQFDFWVGDWNLSWGEDGRGMNHISKMYDDCVIRENFNRGESTRRKGISVSVFNEQTAKWQQTWADNQGGYPDFTGEFKNGKMLLSREFIKDGEVVLQRMVWYNIEENQLDWNWERFDDDEENWRDIWQIHYQQVN